MEEGFTINKAYAAKYDKWRESEELQRLKDKYGDGEDDSDSSSETEDEDADALTGQIEKDWLSTLAALKNKDPKIYQKDYKFYHDETEDKKKGKKEKIKPLFLKDYERKVITEKEGHLSDESESGDEKKYKMGYFEQQEEIKKSIKNMQPDSGDESDNEFLTIKSKTKQQKEIEDEEYVQWLKGHKDELQEEEQVGIELEPLKNFWNNPQLNQGEKFLRDFFLNKNYKEKDSDDVSGFPLVDDGEGMSDEEELLEKQEEFERKYNFRYEEPDKEFIKSFPRVIEDSVRQKVGKRAEKRKEIRERKEKEKEKRKEELKQLKNLKKKEILRKLDQLKDVAGHPEMELNEGDLEEDFDPSKHDEMMKKYFSEDYYGMAAEEQKPEFPDNLDDLQYDNWDEWAGKTEEDGENEEMDDLEMEENNDNQEPHADDPDFNMDADFDPSQQIISKKKKRRKSKLAQALSRKKPVFNPEEKTFDEYLSEYYSLDYEDLIGDKPCRFRYRQVPANNYGLEVNEILKCKEKELNAWVSLKKMVQYRTAEEEKFDARIYQNKAKNIQKKHNILSSLKEELDKKEKFDKKKEKKMERQKQEIDSVAEMDSSVDKSRKDVSATKKRKKVQDNIDDNNTICKKIKIGESEVSPNGDIMTGKKKKRPKKNNALASNTSSSEVLQIKEMTSKSKMKSPQMKIGKTHQTDRGELVMNRKKKNNSVPLVCTQSKQIEKTETSSSLNKSANREMSAKEKKPQLKKEEACSLSSIHSDSISTEKEIPSNTESVPASSGQIVSNAKKKRKKKRKVKKSEGGLQAKTSDLQSNTMDLTSGTAEDKELQSNPTQGERKKRRKKKKKKSQGLPKLSAERLKAYGINPKKLKFLKTDNYKGKMESS